MRTIKYILITLVTLLVNPDAGAQINAEQVMLIGRNSLYFEDYMLSIQYFNQVIQAKPYLAKPYFFRAIAKLNLEDYLGAEEDASKAIELNPFITDAYEVRGVARQNLGKDDEAIKDYKHALSLLPHNRQITFNLALAEQTAGRLDDASATFESLIKTYPGYDNAYVGRARLLLEKGDTVGASADIDKALELNSKSVNAYLMRADIAIKRHADFAKALSDMDEAIKLQPKYAGFYINRAFLRYNLDDYFGAMADYDYAIELDPLSTVARFNRGLLLAEVNANDRALEDFSKVLEIDPEDFRARYNRAVIYSNKLDYERAVEDIGYVIEAFPDFPGALFMRSEFYRQMGNHGRAMADYDNAMALTKSNKKNPNLESSAAASESGTTEGEKPQENTSDSETPDEVSRRFASLLTIENNAEIKEEFNNKDIRGRVQDRNFAIVIEPMMELSYHASPTELRQNTFYIKEVDEINDTRALRQLIVVTNHPPVLSNSEDIDEHFASIEYYNSYIATHAQRAVDFLGRALDFITIHNYPAAIKDIDKAIELTPDFAVGYFLRAQARHRELDSRQDVVDIDGSASPKKNDGSESLIALQLRRQAYNDILADLDKAIALSPRMALAYYNKGNVYVETQNFPAAIEAYGEAIGLKPDLGEAYFNRGFSYLKLGNKNAAISDLSKAGELGVLPAYSLLKRISR